MPFAEKTPTDGPDRERARFERCFRENYASVLAFSMRRTASREAAEDAAAEAFAVAWRRRDRAPDPALPWLYAIALRIIANQRRSGQRRRNLGARLEHEAGAGAPTADPADALHKRNAFATAFASLREPEREVLRLIAWEGLDPSAAARVLGCSTGAFRVRLHRARRKLAKQLRAAGHLQGESRQPAREPAEEVK